MSINQKPAATDALMMLGIELLAVGIFTAIAGANPELGHVMVLWMVGLWLIYLITNSSVLKGLQNGLSNIEQGK